MSVIIIFAPMMFAEASQENEKVTSLDQLIERGLYGVEALRSAGITSLKDLVALGKTDASFIHRLGIHSGDSDFDFSGMHELSSTGLFSPVMETHIPRLATAYPIEKMEWIDGAYRLEMQYEPNYIVATLNPNEELELPDQAPPLPEDRLHMSLRLAPSKDSVENIPTTSNDVILSLEHLRVDQMPPWTRNADIELVPGKGTPTWMALGFAFVKELLTEAAGDDLFNNNDEPLAISRFQIEHLFELESSIEMNRKLASGISLEKAAITTPMHRRMIDGLMRQLGYSCSISHVEDPHFHGTIQRFMEQYFPTHWERNRHGFFESNPDFTKDSKIVSGWNIHYDVRATHHHNDPRDGGRVEPLENRRK